MKEDSSFILRRKVQSTIQKYKLIKKGEKIIVALSGGIDSMTLLHVLLKLSPIYSTELIAAHFNHGIRGEESDRDEHFVRNVCKKWNVELIVGKGKIKSEKGKGLEEAARRARYEFLKNVLQERAAQKVAVAHTKTDSVETFLMRLIRGASPYGLRGIPPKRGEIIRPFIEISREEIENYAEKEKIPFVVDSTNQDIAIFRNWVRHKLIPILKEKNPKIEEALYRLMEIWQKESELLEEKAGQIVKTSLKKDKEGFLLDAQKISYLPEALKRKVLLKTIHTLGKDAEWAHVNTLVKISESKEEKETYLPGGLKVHKTLQGLRFTYKEIQNVILEEDKEIIVMNEGVYVLGDFTFKVRVLSLEGEKLVTKTPWSIAFDADKVDFPLVIRYKKPKDTIYLSKVGHKKLQDLFIDAKIPKKERRRPIILDKNGIIIWIPGIRYDVRFLPQQETTRYLLITAKRQ